MIKYGNLSQINHASRSRIWEKEKELQKEVEYPPLRPEENVALMLGT